ncbi:MAG: fibrobacter succinogenes major paralogous domain-containing protein [Chitinispirillia bacterium]|nr:fibrobacter succinogenes major paralogous domain-containing protein [Chitinispirillia bacterium]MCL2268996.1 fibrobacter succinogenes major paralogous domain-containing protein [Chitinispirillia bacterium]
MNASVGGKSRRAAGRVVGAAVIAVLLSVSAVNAQGGSFTDARDGKTYRTVKIGDQTWMAENLNYKTGKSVCYDNEESNCQKYGRLYNWDDAMKACPAGWRLSSSAEWTALTYFVGGREVAGTKLKSKTGWSTDKGYEAATDDYGFSALPGGYGDSGGNFNDADYYGYWWSATKFNAYRAWGRIMFYGIEGMDKYYADKPDLYSVRCVRDSAAPQ